MANNNSTNFTTIATGSGSAVMATNTHTGFTIAGAGSISTSASGSTITVSGSSGSGPIQQKRSTTSTPGSSSTQIPVDDTIPQNTEGAEVLTVSITPTSASNILVIEYNFWATFPPNGQRLATSALFQDSTANAIYAQLDTQLFMSSGETFSGTVYGRHIMAAGTTSATTFKLRVGPGNASTYYWLSTGGFAKYGGVNLASLVVTEWPP